MSMDTLLDMRTAVQSDLTVDGTSDLFSPDTIDLDINRAYRKAGGLFRWTQLQDALSFSAKANQQYYDEPDTWYPDSIYNLSVDGTDYGDKMVFKDFKFEIANNNPSGIINKWSVFQGKIFIDPTPTVDGSFNINILGQKVTEELDEDEDTTVFSSVMPEVNEAIVLEALAILHAKGDEAQLAGQFYSPQAVAIISNAWQRIKQDTSKAEKTQPFFDVPDFFGRLNVQTVKKKIGNF